MTREEKELLLQQSIDHVNEKWSDTFKSLAEGKDCIEEPKEQQQEEEKK